MLHSRPSLQSSLALVVALVASMAACTPSEGISVEAPAERAERFGLVQVSAASGRTVGSLDNRVVTAVHFVEHRGIERVAVAQALDAWSPRSEDGCVVLEAPRPAGPGASLDLLSAGTVGISGNGGSTALTPRFLGSGPQLSGFIYGGEQEHAPIWAAGELFTVWASGEEIGPFAVTVPAPERVQLVTLAGRELGSATEIGLPVEQDLAFELFTDASEVYVSLRTLAAFGGVRAECRFGAVEGVSFDAEELRATFGDADLELTVHTAATAPLPESARVEGSVVSEVYDRLVVRR